MTFWARKVFGTFEKRTRSPSSQVGWFFNYASIVLPFSGSYSRGTELICVDFF